MTVSFNDLVPGGLYNRPDLAALWGYAGYEAIARGAVTPSGTPFIILFITKDKQSFLPQYKDQLHKDRLAIEGENNHSADARIVAARRRGDQIHLFYRGRHHRPFEYKGEIYLVSAELRTDGPSQFEFVFDPTLAQAINTLETELLTHGTDLRQFVPDQEGRRRIRRHTTYERSPRNRARAIAVHGTRCLACGFSFDETYGSEHAEHYVEVHHVVSVASGPSTPNPVTDLVPLCSNCHSMAHRRRGTSLSLEDLRALLRRPRPSSNDQEGQRSGAVR